MKLFLHRSTGVKNILLILPAILFSQWAIAQGAVINCDEQQATLQRVTAELKDTRTKISADEKAVAEKNALIKSLSKQIADLYVLKHDEETVKGKAAIYAHDMMVNRKSVVVNEKNVIEKRLPGERSQETYLVNSYQLIRDRLDKDCGGVKTIVAKKTVDISKITGMWRSDWGDVELFISEASVTGSWNQGEGSQGIITGGTFSTRANILHFTYTQPWNKQHGYANLVLTESLLGYTLSGPWHNNENGGGGTWTMTKKK